MKQMEQTALGTDRYSDLYSRKFGRFIRNIRTAGPLTLIVAKQMAGDLSRAATKELVLARTLSRSFHTVDFGAGRKAAWWGANDFAICPPDFANTVISDSPHQIQIVAMHYPAVLALDLQLELPQDADFGPLHGQTPLNASLASLLDQLLCGEEADADADTMLAETIIVTLFERLQVMTDGPQKRRPILRERLSGWQRRKAVDRLMALEQPPPTLSELAAFCGMSPSHFCRAFRAETGLSPRRYQVVKRIERARDLLSQSQLAVAAVAEKIGYDDPAYFSRVFTRETGFSPSEWRRESRN